MVHMIDGWQLGDMAAFEALFRQYEKLGFKILGTRKGYYTNPIEDAYVMGLVLGP